KAGPEKRATPVRSWCRFVAEPQSGSGGATLNPIGPASEAPASALTYAEAQERSRLIDLRGYRIDLDLSGGQDTFGSVTDVRFGCREPGSASFIELSPGRLARGGLTGRGGERGALH